MSKITELSLLVFSLYGFTQTASGAYRIDTVAGSDSVGDGGAAVYGSLRDCQSIAVDHAGNIYVADPGDHRVRKINASGTITTVAGIGNPGFSGDDGPANLAQLNLPYGVAVDPAGNIIIADLGNNKVRRISPTGTITSIGGVFRSPRNVAADAQGNIYVSEFDGNRVSRINLDGTVTVIAGTGVKGHSGDFGPASAATLNSPAGLALDLSGNLYIADSGNSQVRKVSGNVITTVLGTGIAGMSSAMQLNLPTGVALDPFGNLYVADSQNQRVRKLSSANAVSTIALPARDVAIDLSGNLLIANGSHVTKQLVSGVVANIAGDGSYLFRGDGGPAKESRLNQPAAIAIDAKGMLWIADTANSRIRSLSSAGTISTIAGPTTLHAPQSLLFDGQSNLLIADPPSGVVWKLPAAPAPPLLTTAAGNGFQAFSGDGFPATLSALSLPSSAVPTPDGGFFIADTANHRIRRVNTAGILTTVAGTDHGGFTGDGAALGVSLNSPTALALDATGSLYIADTGNDRVRKWTSDGSLVTIAGGPGAALALKGPRGLAIDNSGTLWISDTGNNRVLTLAANGTLTIAAGKGTFGFSGDGGSALDAEFRTPLGLATDSAGNMYVADSGNNRIRILIAPPPAVTEAAGASFTVASAASLQSGPAAPCSLVTVFGPQADTLPILVDGIAAVPIASTLNQATVQVPCSAAPPSVLLSAGNGWHSAIAIVPAAPALFALNAGAGQALALNANGTPNSEGNPAAPESTVTLYATGMGATANSSGVVVGQSAATVLYVGDAPGLIGITQINIVLPSGVRGIQPVLVLSANVASQASVTLAIATLVN